MIILLSCKVYKCLCMCSW